MLAPWRICYMALVIIVAANPKNSTTTTSSPLRTKQTSSTSTETTTIPEEEDNVNEVDAEYEIYYQDYTSPTFVTPVEKFIQTLIGPLNSQGRNEEQSGLGAIISGITKPIRDVVKPVVNSRTFGEVLNLIGDRFKAIYPGTAWCGAGNAAQNSQELGFFEKTDRCCQAHDKCTMSMEAGHAEHGLLNNGMFTRSHCVCDANFYYCLKKVRSLISSNIGYTYFNLLRPQCFKYEYPAFCMRYGNTRLMNNKCLDYGYNYDEEKKWQWFDSPDFF